MKEYVHTASIPIESESQSIVFADGLYFSSHTNIYKTENNLFSIFTSVEGTIKHFAVNSHNIFICTEDRVYMNHRDTNIGSLRRAATAIDANESIFAIGVGNSLEIWRVPKEYSFTLFKNIGKFPGHHRPIKIIKILDDAFILTVSEDNSVRLFNIQKRTTKVIISSRSTLVGLHMFDQKRGAVTANDGSIISFNLDFEKGFSENQCTTVDGKIISSCCNEEITVIILEKTIEQTKKEEQEDAFHFKPNSREISPLDQKSEGVDLEVIKPAYKKPCGNYFMVIFKDGDELYRVDIDQKVYSVCIRNNAVAMLSKNYIGIFDILSEKFTFSMNLVKITGFTVTGENVAASCADRRVRIYDNQTCKAVLYDSKSRGDVLDGIIRDDSCIVTYRNGYVSVFNINDSLCYRSFSIGGADGLCTDFKFSAVDDDGRILFVATDKLIYIIDLQRSKKIDQVNLDYPLASLIYHRSCLFYLNLKNELVRFSVYNSESSILRLETNAVGLAVQHNSIAVSTASEIIIYDLDFNYLNSIGVSLEGRHRNEVFSRNKPVEQFDFDSSRIFCGGQTNIMKILEYGKEDGTLYANGVIQTLKVSMNKEWENYKEKLGREKSALFNQKNFIEVRKIVAGTSKFYVLTREGIKIYERVKQAFNPIEFQLDFTAEFVKQSLHKQNYLSALLVSLHLGEYTLIDEVLQMTDDIRHTAEHVPKEYVDILLRYMSEIYQNDPSNIKPLEFIRWTSFYHKASLPGLYEMIKANAYDETGEYESLRKAYFLLKSITASSEE